MSQKIIEALHEQFGEEVVLATHAHRGDETAEIVSDMIREVCRFLKDEPEMAFEQIIDITCVDWLGQTPRFEVVYHLHSLSKKHRVRLKCRVDEADPRLPSVQPVWKGASWYEREAFDMYGVVFDDHPDLRRLLMYPEFVGHPLRKDYPIRGEQPLVTMRDPETQRPVMPNLAGGDLVQLQRGGPEHSGPEGEAK